MSAAGKGPVTLSFLHQKGGTGKSTLAIAAAMRLARAGRNVLLLDADYQGTSSEWGNRHGHALGIETRSQVQPIIHEQRDRFAAFSHIVIDGPPSLSPMTESVLAASDRVFIPCRPALPDVWAMAWLGAMIAKRLRGGDAFRALVIFNQHGGEDLAPLTAEMTRWNLPVHPHPVPMAPEFQALFHGTPLPPEVEAAHTGWLDDLLVG